MRFTISMMAAVMIWTGLAQAQDGERRAGSGMDPQAMIERMFQNDENEDGKLSADEVNDRLKRIISRADTDEDGFATKEELTILLEKNPDVLSGLSGEGRTGRGGEGGFGLGRGGRGGAGGIGSRGGDGGRGGAGGIGSRGGDGGRGGMGGPDGQAEGMMRLLSMFPIMKALDSDGNGELSTKEIENAVAALKSLDKDQNGTLTVEEMMPDMSQMRGGFGQGGPGRPGPGAQRGGQNRQPQRPEMDDDDDGSQR